MRIELRGTISASLGVPAFEVELPETGLPLDQLLGALATSYPRATRYLAGEPFPTLRIVLNGSVLEANENPVIHKEDSLMLIQAVAGGKGYSEGKP